LTPTLTTLPLKLLSTNESGIFALRSSEFVTRERSSVTYAPLYSFNSPLERTDVTDLQACDAQEPEAESRVVVRRHLTVADRALIQLATSVVRGDPVKSLVELITNSDDSYRRNGSKNDSSYGRIIITLDRQQNSFTVLDFAQGISVDNMDKCVGTYGSDVSGFNSGYSVRGFYGRGLKEAILGLGSGIVRSIKDGSLNECFIHDDGLYIRNEQRPAVLSDYLELGIPHGKNGTRVHVVITKIKKMPAWSWISYALSNHWSLRDIMQSSRRRVILSDGQKSEILGYKPPSGKLVLSKQHLPIPGFNTHLDICVYKADKPLSQEGYTRDGGILIRSKNAIHESTLFKFDYSPYATRLFGEARCDFIEELMSKGELVINDKRDGLDQHHPFTKMLRKVVENELQPIIDREINSQEAQTKSIGEDLRKRLSNVLWEVNKLAIRLTRNSIRFDRAAPSGEHEHSTTASPHLRHQTNDTEKYPILFKGIRLNAYQDPKVRVCLDKGTGIINIATRAPSVAMYYAESQESREFLALIAELISDTVFLELAETVSSKAGSERVSETYSILKNKYSHLIHKSMQIDTQDLIAEPHIGDWVKHFK